MAGATGELILKNYGLYAAIDELTDRLEDIENIYAGAELPTNILKAKGELVAAMNSLEDTQHTLEYTLTKKAPADIKKSSSELVGAQTALAEAKERLRDATLVAPFAGIVDEVKEDIHVGSVISGQDKVITLVDPTQVEVEAIIDEIDVLQVKPGQKARIFLDALPEVEIEGKVRALATLATEEKGVVNYRTWIDIAVPPGIELKHGLTAFVEILVEGKENVLMVPSRAIKMTQRGPVVEVVVDEKTQEQKVVPGISDGVWTEIVEGLVEGETILLP
jgi:RND family efflux transporter MFP subunit